MTSPTTNALAIDTTSDFLALAVQKGGEPPWGYYARTGPAMTARLFSVLDGLLEQAGLTPGDVELVVAARGPGSFTGTRIGLAVARTLAQLGDVPLVGVDTLHLLAAQAAPPEGAVVHALLNCARDEVYHAPFKRQDGLLRAQGPIELTTFAHLAERVGDEPVVLRCFDTSSPHQVATLKGLNRAPHGYPEPDAVLLLREGRALLAAAAPPPPAEPIYVKTEAFRTWTP